MSTEQSMMATVDMKLATKSFRDSLLPSVRDARAQVSMARYIEDHYDKTIQDLAGTSFVPLAGFTIVLDQPVAESTAGVGFPDQIFHLTYVEYTTGFRLKMLGKVVLDEGYFPIGVSWKALEDAVTVRMELLLNECGYTTADNPISGLRKASFSFGNGLLEALFTADRRIFQYINDDHREYRENAEFIDTPENLVFRIPVTSLKSRDSYGFMDRGEGPYYIHRSRLGILESFVGKKIWFNTQRDHKSLGDAILVTDGDVMKLDAPTIKERDRYECKRTYSYILSINPLETQQDEEPSELEIKDGYLYLSQTKEWMNPPEYKRLFKFDKPDEWRIVYLSSVSREIDHYGIGIRQSTFPMSYLNKVAELFKNNSYVAPVPEKVHVPVIDVAVYDSTPYTTTAPRDPDPISPPLPTQRPQTLTGRFSAAWKAFWS